LAAFQEDSTVDQCVLVSPSPFGKAIQKREDDTRADFIGACVHSCSNINHRYLDRWKVTRRVLSGDQQASLQGGMWCACRMGEKYYASCLTMYWTSNFRSALHIRFDSVLYQISGSQTSTFAGGVRNLYRRLHSARYRAASYIRTSRTHQTMDVMTATVEEVETRSPSSL
jgi:hypothetical protein